MLTTDQISRMVHNEDCGDATSKPQKPTEITGTFATIESAYCKNNLIGCRISTSGVAQKFLIFSDQEAMPGVRLGDGFIPDIGESIEYRYVPLAAESEYINKLEEAASALVQYEKEIEALKVDLHIEIASASVKDSEIAILQSKLDRLMFEYCPEDMTKEQVNKWGKHQVVFKE